MPVPVVVSSAASASTQTKVEPRAWHHGDVLHQTRCYCISPSFAADHTYGYYFLFRYYNFHLDRWYEIEMTCNSNKIVNLRRFNQPLCLRDSENNKKDKSYTIDDRGNKLWYELDYQEFEDWYGVELYGFNGQKRDVPDAPSFWFLGESVEKVCEPLCKEKVARTVMLKRESQPKDFLFRTSRRYYNTDLADMCDRCA